MNVYIEREKREIHICKIDRYLNIYIDRYRYRCTLISGLKIYENDNSPTF